MRDISTTTIIHRISEIVEEAEQKETSKKGDKLMEEEKNVL
jgi:hypothetical protein